MESPNILLARQPIYDKDLKVYAYELLFRPQLGSDWKWDGDLATSQLVINAFAEIGIERVCDNKTAFINFTRKWLISPPPFDANHVAIEVLETVEPDAEVIAGIRKMAAAGFTIALDDFVYHDKWHPILEVADIVKVDVLNHTGPELETMVEKLAKYNVKLLAEKVESYQDLERCQALNFDYFQGFFLCHPQNIHGDSLPTNKVVVMRLLAELQNPNSTVKSLEDIIANDISLSTKILRICNTAQYTSVAKITSIRQAVVLIGLDALKRWSSIIALSKMSDKPNELICLSLSRAKMMELLAVQSGEIEKESFFTVGMFSLMDAFFDQPKDKLLKTLPFDTSLNDALLRYEGPAGALLKALEAHEKGRWEDIDWNYLASKNIEQPVFEKAYTESIVWATDIIKSLLA